MKDNTLKIAIVGSGNIAFQMTKRLHSNGVTISHIISRNKTEGALLADITKSTYTAIFNDKSIDVDAYLLAISDKAILEVSKSIDNKDALMIHTSGTVDIDALASKNKAVIWPLYSISKDKNIDWDAIPLITEASNKKAKTIVDKICFALGGTTYILNSKQRSHSHLMAVLINNLTVHYFDLIRNYQNEYKIDSEMFELIIKDTFTQVLGKNIHDDLTGPARRNDLVTINRQKELLEDKSILKEIYTLLSDSIITTYHGKKL